MIEDGVLSATSLEQHALEQRVKGFYQELQQESARDQVLSLGLLRDKHTQYLYKGLKELPAAYATLGASRPWICYWIVHSLALLKAPLPSNVSARDIITFLKLGQDPSGGFGGAPGQVPHLAPTYAAVCALITLGGEAALAAIDRAALWGFLKRMCVGQSEGGGMRVSEGGEVDIRGCYTAVAVAHMLQLDVRELVRLSGMADYIVACQTYEGGFGGEPGNEAHGGYTFCGLAALLLAGCADRLDLPGLLEWCVFRQGCIEGGFNGRTNKLVDGCYSFWVGGVFPLLQRLRPVMRRQVAARGEALRAGAAGRKLDVLEPSFRPAVPPSSQIEEELERMQAQLDEAAAELSRDEASGAASSDLSTSERRASLERAGELQQLVDRLLDSAEAVCSSAGTLASELSRASSGTSAAAAPAGRSGDDEEVLGTGGGDALYNSEALQLWILACCQVAKGGLRDKPGQAQDYYHTCYCLSGLSSAQHYGGGGRLGPSWNLLERADPLCNVVADKLEAAREWFAARPV